MIHGICDSIHIHIQHHRKNTISATEVSKTGGTAIRNPNIAIVCNCGNVLESHFAELFRLQSCQEALVTECVVASIRLPGHFRNREYDIKFIFYLYLDCMWVERCGLFQRFVMPFGFCSYSYSAKCVLVDDSDKDQFC